MSNADLVKEYDPLGTGRWATAISQRPELRISPASFSSGVKCRTSTDGDNRYAVIALNRHIRQVNCNNKFLGFVEV